MSRRAVARCAASKPPSLMPALAPQDVDVDTLYMLRINIKNVHARAHRVKIVPPETSHFKLLYVPGEPLAPGLEVSAEVEFRAREARDSSEWTASLEGVVRRRVRAVGRSSSSRGRARGGGQRAAGRRQGVNGGGVN